MADLISRGLRRALPHERVEIVSSRGAGKNEDIAGYAAGRYWVLDGATPLVPSRGMPDPQAFVDAADVFLRRSSALGSAPTIEALLESLGRRLRAKLPRAEVDPASIPTAAIALVQATTSRAEIGVLGDVTVVVRPRNGRTTVVTDPRIRALDQRAVRSLQRLVRSGVSYERARREVLPLLIDHRRSRDADASYWILGDRPSSVSRARLVRIPVGAGTQLLLATDGFARVVDVYRAFASWAALMRSLKNESLRSALDDLRDAERRDPQCRLFPRLSPADDATALYVEFAAPR